ncbi:hypothetical protein Forpe1208_v007962 [Fusarium oxysporum f. sp. rapae]|uniref:Uncharacterized protein n=1 Tax=Fusarium oxysporum f. sp. rapae TaxID=485398 RepID=A0A8J5NW80_FUSOX|nr:hypothetical protein Forpe1208_v007962 [Fusarium oxysporum f. sp. rapae]
MKASAAYLLTALLSAAQLSTNVTGYAPAEFATLARDAGATISTYHPPFKKCVVGREGGTEKPNTDTYYMVKVEEEVRIPSRETRTKKKIRLL